LSEHFTRGTLECTAYCNKCEDFTQHRVDGGRRGPCLKCIERLEQRIARVKGEKAEHARQNPSLFPEAT